MTGDDVKSEYKKMSNMETFCFGSAGVLPYLRPGVDQWGDPGNGIHGASK